MPQKLSKKSISQARLQKYYSLPNDLREIMFDVEIAEKIWTIAHDNFNLPKEKVRVVADTIELTIFGEIPVKDFVAELASALQIDTQKATALAKDINEQIFQPVRESMMEVHGITSEKSKVESQKQEAHTGNQKPEVNNQEGVSLDDLEKRSKSQSGTSSVQSEPTPQQAPSPSPKSSDEDSGETPLEPTSPQASSASNGVKKLEINGDERAKKQALREGQERARQEAEARRARLIQRLKQTQGAAGEETRNPESSDGAGKKPRRKVRGGQETRKTQGDKAGNQPGPQARTAAWDGNTIDLSKIPPRRRSPNKSDENIQEV